MSEFQQERWVFPFIPPCMAFFMQADDRRVKSQTIKTSVEWLQLSAYITFMTDACLWLINIWYVEHADNSMCVWLTRGFIIIRNPSLANTWKYKPYWLYSSHDSVSCIFNWELFNIWGVQSLHHYSAFKGERYGACKAFALILYEETFKKTFLKK